MRPGSTNLLMTVLVLAPVALMAQEPERTSLAPVVSFADAAPGPFSVELPQSSGEKDPAVAALLNALLLPGIGNFYAGHHGHGLRHVGLAIGGATLVVVGALQWDDHDGGGEVLMVASAAVVAVNWVWSIFSGISDANAAGGAGPADGNMASIVQPQFVPLAGPQMFGDPSGVSTPRLGLQLIRLTF